MLTRSEKARQIARRLARRAFAGNPDVDALTNDAESVAWELETTARPNVRPASVAFMAVRRVKCGRQYKQSVRGILTGRYDKRSKRPDLTRVNFDFRELCDDHEPPSESVPLMIDFQAWMARHDDRKRAIAEALAVGGTTKEVARDFDVSAGRISQLRGEFHKSWQVFQEV
jgi:hypothetical protein